jgi:hypothetical protein
MTGPLVRQPHRVGKRLLPPLADRFSARRGTYRIICRIDDATRTVTVVDVDPPQGCLPSVDRAARRGSGDRCTASPRCVPLA